MESNIAESLSKLRNKLPEDNFMNSKYQYSKRGQSSEVYPIHLEIAIRLKNMEICPVTKMGNLI